MKTFSIKRALQLSRLEITELLESKPLKVCTFPLYYLIPLLILSYLGSNNSFDKYIGSVERLYTLLSLGISIVLIYTKFLVSNKLLLPATLFEKYCSIYFSSLFITILWLVIAIIPVTLICYIIQQISYPDYTGGLHLFLLCRSSFHSDIFILLFTAILIFSMVNIDLSNKFKSRFMRIASTAIICLLIIGPGLLFSFGWIGEETKHLLFQISLGSLMFFLFYYNYILFKGVEVITHE